MLLRIDCNTYCTQGSQGNPISLNYKRDKNPDFQYNTRSYLKLKQVIRFGETKSNSSVSGKGDVVVKPRNLELKTEDTDTDQIDTRRIEVCKIDG